MSDETLNAPPLTFDPDNPGRNIVRHCRSLTVAGAPCRQAALRGEDYCTIHANREARAFEEPGHIVIPLLEDASAIQLTCTKIVHGVANRRTSPTEANSMLRACAVAASTLPRPARLKPSAEPEPVQPPFSSIALDENNNFIAPRKPWLDAAGNLAQYDSFVPRFTNQKIDPATAVTERYRSLIFELIQQRADRDTAESAAALAAGLPDPHLPGKWRGFKTGHCAFLTAFCYGPLDPEPCDYCLGVLQMPSDHSYYPGDDAIAIVTALRNHLQQQKTKPNPQQPQQQNNNQPQQQQDPQQQQEKVAESSCPAPQQDQNASRLPNISAVGDVALTRRKARRRRRHQSRVPHLSAVGDVGHTRRKPRGESRLPHVAGLGEIRTRGTSSARSLANQTLAKRRPANRTPAHAHVVKFANTATGNIPKDKKLVPAKKHNFRPNLQPRQIRSEADLANRISLAAPS